MSPTRYSALKLPKKLKDINNKLQEPYWANHLSLLVGDWNSAKFAKLEVGEEKNLKSRDKIELEEPITKMKTIAQVWTLAVVGQQVWLYTDTKGKDVLEHHTVEFAREATWDKYKDCC